MRPARAALLALALAGCAGAPLRPPGAPQRLELEAVPFFAQDRFQCGPAALATVLSASGVAVEPDALVPEVYLPARHGSLQAELLAAARRHGRLAYRLPPQPAALYAELAAGRPVLVLQNFGSTRHPGWHYAVVVGVEPGHVLLRSGTTRRQRLAESRFAGTWERADRWAFVVLRPGELPVSDDARAYIEAAAAFEPLGTVDDSVAAYAAATGRWPREPAAWFGLGNQRDRAGDSAAAEAAFRAALAVAPGYAAARNNLADLLARRGCLAAAREQLELAAQAASGSALEAAISASRHELEAQPPAPEAPGCPRP